MIVGVGIDAVELARFERAITRTPRLIERLFVASEQTGSVRSLAGRFAAKEAFIKAVGSPSGMKWHEVVVGKEPSGRPVITVSGGTAITTAAAGIDKFHLSITHDGAMAMAYVVAENTSADGAGFCAI